MKQIINLGKVDYTGNGIRDNLITIELELIEKENGLVFSACGNVWNRLQTDLIRCGQCLDDLLELMPNDNTLKTLVPIWRRWHLNDMRSGPEYKEDWGFEPIPDDVLQTIKSFMN